MMYCPVTIAEGPHPFPFRTRKLSPPAPMVLPFGGRVGRCRAFFVTGLVAGRYGQDCLALGRADPAGDGVSFPQYFRAALVLR